ncbi:MAG TPA: group 1 truncated hemoglobin [Luteibaculaceae bacterium]|nr:group 1 truncated hemoglobin [Luteibaculaceae bacterium]
MKNKSFLLALALVAGSLAFQNCAKDPEPTPAPAAAPTLYERVGGTKMVADPNNPGQMIETGRLTLRSVVDSAIFVIAGDTSMTRFFPVLLGEVGRGDLSGFNALSKSFTDFLCVATGSKNFTYTGLNMVDAHDPAKNNRMGEKAGNTDFNNFVTDVGVALGKNGVTDQKLIGDLVALLETTRSAVVQK